MARFRNVLTGVEVTVADGKHPAGYEPVDTEKAPAKKSAAKPTAKADNK